MEKRELLEKLKKGLTNEKATRHSIRCSLC